MNEIPKSSSSRVAADIFSLQDALTSSEKVGVNDPCHGFTGGVTAHNGHVIARPAVFVIYWDAYFQTNPDAVSSMNRFVGDLVGGAYMIGLRDYGVGFGSFAGSVVLDLKTHPAPASLSNTQLASTLVDWLNDGTVPQKPTINDTSHVYLVFAPSTTALTLGTITGGFCGYHQSTKFNSASGNDDVFWAVVQGYSKAAVGNDFVNSISYCVSHELNESFSDRDGQGYNASNGCEIGDLCEQNGTVAYGDWQVQPYWSNSANGCVGPLFTRELGWAGIYRPDKGALWFDVRSDLASFNADVDARFKQGLYLTDVTTFNASGQTHWTGVYRPDNGALWFDVRPDLATFNANVDARFKQGLYLTAVTAYQEGGQTRWAGIFRPGSGALWFDTRPDLISFNADVDARFKQGLYLTDVTTFPVGGQTHWAGIFRPGSGALWFDTRPDLASFSADVDARFKQGLYLTDAVTFQEGSQTRWAGIFRPGSGALWFDTRYDLATFNADVSSRFAQSLYLTHAVALSRDT